MISSVNAPTQTYKSVFENVKSYEETSQLGEESYMELLIAQLKNQDPTQAMDQKEMIGQMTQFSNLKQTTKLTTLFEKFFQTQTFQNATNLIGEEVAWLNSQGEIEKGIVNGVNKKENKVFVNVNDQKIDVDEIFSVNQTQEINKVQEENTVTQ